MNLFLWTTVGELFNCLFLFLEEAKGVWNLGLCFFTIFLSVLTLYVPSRDKLLALLQLDFLWLLMIEVVFSLLMNFRDCFGVSWLADLSAILELFFELLPPTRTSFLCPIFLKSVLVAEENPDADGVFIFRMFCNAGVLIFSFSKAEVGDILAADLKFGLIWIFPSTAILIASSYALAFLPSKKFGLIWALALDFGDDGVGGCGKEDPGIGGRARFEKFGFTWILDVLVDCWDSFFLKFGFTWTFDWGGVVSLFPLKLGLMWTPLNLGFKCVPLGNGCDIFGTKNRISLLKKSHYPCGILYVVCCLLLTLTHSFLLHGIFNGRSARACIIKLRKLSCFSSRERARSNPEM